MSHSVVALVMNGCGHCDQFHGDIKKEPDLAKEISVCEKGDTTCQYLCDGTEGGNCTYPNDRALDGFPTFKCVKKNHVISGYAGIENLKEFVAQCKES